MNVFLDDGGVLNDNRLRGPQWLSMIGEFMAPRLGGEPEAWRQHNRAVFTEVWGGLTKRLPEFETFMPFQREYAISWLHGMCERIGVPAPSDDEAFDLHCELAVHIAERAVCAYDGAADTVRMLSDSGHTLYMASGTPSWELQGILGRMGILELFTGLYGPDLIDYVKYSSTFYEKIFAHAGVAPDRALVFESDEQCCEWARAAGARAIWVDDQGHGDALSLLTAVEALESELRSN